jgi:hypothetical protein
MELTAEEIFDADIGRRSERISLLSDRLCARIAEEAAAAKASEVAQSE